MSIRHKIESGKSIRKANILTHLIASFYISSSPYSLRVATNNGAPICNNILPKGYARIRPLQWQLKSLWRPNMDPMYKILPTMLGRQLNARCTTSTTTDRSPPVFGRIIQSVRDTHEWSESVTDMEPCPTTATYKPPGTSCSMGRNEIILMTNMQQNCNDNVRQYSSIYIKKKKKKKRGGIKSNGMCNLTLKLQHWSEEHNVTMVPRHILGHMNVLADQLSRQEQKGIL